MIKRTALVCAALVVVACDKPSPPPADTTPATPPPPAAAAPATSTDPAPATFRVRFETSKGPFVVEVQRDMAPNGADRFYHLVESNFYDDVRFFRVLPGFVVQFGMNGDPATNARWTSQSLQDDPVKGSNARGTLTYAQTTMPNSRTTQLFINLADNQGLDAQGFAPFGRVVEGMDVIDKLNSEYGDAPSNQQGVIAAEGNAFLNRQYPRLDFVRTARVVR
jgi:peptidyl-prolyl cis-trans isomerase A (cyclophilin A)